MSVIHKDKWPTVFSGLRAVTLNDLSREISAGITLFTPLLRVRNCNRKHNTKMVGTQVFLELWQMRRSIWSTPRFLRKRSRNRFCTSIYLKIVCAGCGTIVDIESTGAETLNEVLKSLAKSGVNVAVNHANKLIAALLSAYHLLDLIGNERLYPIIRHAIAAFRNEMGYYENECGS